MTTGDDPRVGQVLHGRYRVLERMTAGSMGVVYRAERVGLGRSVAVKVLHESYAATEDGMRRFEVEARATSRLAHPNCVSVIDFGVHEGAPYLVMDYLTGRTLREVIQQDGRLPPPRAVAIMRQVLLGLAHAHSHGIVHRDIKPENIVVTSVEGHTDQVKLLDFGLAKLRDEKTVTTGVAVGTPGYMSPEQTVGINADERADIYAAGIILYELLVGWKPFRAESQFEVMRMHREDPPPPLSSAAPDVAFSSRLEGAVQRALAKDREQRFPIVDAFVVALEATPEARGRRAWLSPRRFAMIAAVAALLVVGATIWWSASASSGLAPAPATKPADEVRAAAADAGAPVLEMEAPPD